MAEILLSYAFILSVGLVSDGDYKEYLDGQFMKDPEHALLLELEWSTSDIPGTIKVIFDYCLENDVDYDTFGRFLMIKLEEIYDQEKMEIQFFSSKMYSIWEMLPYEMQNEEPFLTLCHADDSMSWGDEGRTRELYQKMFQYYQ